MAQTLNQSVERRKCSDPALDAVFTALGDPTRRAILVRLGQGKTSVSDLAKPFDMTLAGVAKHVAVLEGAGLISKKQVGRAHICALKPRKLAMARAWLAAHRAFWAGNLDSLARFVEEEEA